MPREAKRPLETPAGPIAADRGAARPLASREYPDRVAAAIRSALGPNPAPLIGVWRRASSTNELARLAAANLAEAGGSACPGSGSVFVAEEQTAGRGRYGRRWASPTGGLYLSLLTASSRASSSRQACIRELALLPIAAGLAAVEAVRRATGESAAIRWPNDLDLHGRKIAGVLIEAGFVRDHPELAVVGFGINCRPLSVGSIPAGTVPPGWLPREVDRPRLAGALVAAFREAASLLDRDPAELRARWESQSPSSRGRRCRVRLSGGDWIEGTTDGLDPDGGLRVLLDGGGRKVIHASEAVRVEHRLARPEECEIP